jgi:uncharacterized damage-inducible protein DinB
MQPDQANFLLQVFLPSLQNEHQITKKVIAAIPADKAGYRPDEISKSALELSWHIAVTEMRFLDSIVAGEFDTGPRPRPESVQTPEELLAWYEENFASRTGAVSQLSGEQLAKIVDFRGIFQLPAVLFLNFVTHHTVHHRGQLSMYLRPMGAKVPAIYGESYDSAAARKAAAEKAAQQGA